MTTISKLLACLALLLCLSAAARTNRIYFIGNSVTDTIRYDKLQAFAQLRGHVMPWGRQMIPGAPLEWLWQHPGDGFQEPPYGYPTNALPNYEWDCVSLQPFDRLLSSDTNDAGNFIRISLPRNTNCQYYIYSRWPRQENFHPDFDGTWLTNYTGGWDNTNETRDYFQKLLLALRGVWSNTPLVKTPLLVPVGDVLYALNQKMKAGAIPGLTNIVQFYADGIHFNNTGAYVVGCTYYTTLFKENPYGLPSEYYGLTNTAFAGIFQTTVWETVSTHPYSGVTVPEPLAGVLLLLALGARPRR
ncbi:MAG: hypothetical protein NTV22_13035 [bacterium]|nr:hypothetical protein [bacterium]